MKSIRIADVQRRALMSDASDPPCDYPWIKKWHERGGSQPYYVEQLIERAKREGAPADAIYWSPDDGRWMTIADVTNEQTLHALGLKR